MANTQSRQSNKDDRSPADRSGGRGQGEALPQASLDQTTPENIGGTSRTGGGPTFSAGKNAVGGGATTSGAGGNTMTGGGIATTTGGAATATARSFYDQAKETAG